MSDTSGDEYKVSSVECEDVQSDVLHARTGRTVSEMSKAQSLSIRSSILHNKTQILKEQLEKTWRDIREFCEDADSFPQRLQAATEQGRRARRYYLWYGQREPLIRARHALHKIKKEFKVLRYRASESIKAFNELQSRIMEQEKRAALLESECNQGLDGGSSGAQVFGGHAHSNK